MSRPTSKNYHIILLEDYYTEFLHLKNNEWYYITETRGSQGCRKPIKTTIKIITPEEAERLKDE